MKTALVFGSSGLVGGHLVNQLILNSNYSKIKIFVRSKIELINPKIEIIDTNFNDLEKHRNDITGEDCFFCIGTTRKNSPNKNEYERIEFNILDKLPKSLNQIQLNHFFLFHLVMQIQKVQVII